MYGINEAAAKRAHEANSFREYVSGSATSEYNTGVEKAREIAERQKQSVDPMYHKKIDKLFDSYCRKLAENMNKGYEIDARVPSVMIAGGSNFPTRSKEKQNAARDANFREWQEIQGLLDKIRSIGMGGISASDPDAVSKLQAKLAKLEQYQETMKAVNAYFRKHKTLDGCPQLTLEEVEQVKAEMDASWHWGDKPYMPFQLSNNNAEIRRLKARIDSLKSIKESGGKEMEISGVKYIENTEIMRVQFVFEEKPDEDTRTILKRNGFKWAPSKNAWQRQLTANGKRAAKNVVAELMERGNENEI